MIVKSIKCNHYNYGLEVINFDEECVSLIIIGNAIFAAMIKLRPTNMVTSKHSVRPVIKMAVISNISTDTLFMISL